MSSLAERVPEADPEREAAEWIVRLNDGRVSAETTAAFLRWQRRNAANAAAFGLARQAWDQMGLLATDRCAASVRAGSRPWFASWKGTSIASGAALMLLLAIGSAWLGDPVTRLSADYRTGRGGVRDVALADGSHVDLAPSSAIAVHFDAKERRIALLAGLAYVRAVPQAQAGGRPFVVTAGPVRSTALGTRFQVERQDGATAVTVIEHQVAVTGFSATGARMDVVLRPGQRVRTDSAGHLGGIEVTDPDLALAWQRGRLVFDRAPLGAVMATLNRYRARHVFVFGSRLRAQRVSGVFDGSDIEGAIAALAGEVGARRVDGPLVTALY